MATTLSRRIRRIGILPTTFIESTETRLVNEGGKEVEKEFKLKRPVRHRENLDEATRARFEQDIRSAHKVSHKEFRTKSRAEHKAAKDRIKTLRTAGKAKK